jgi:hypothetical protein
MQRALVNNVSIKILFMFFLFQFSYLVAQSSAPPGTKTYGLEYDDQGSELILNEDGGYLFLGTLNNAETNSEDMWLVELDSSGEIIWQQIYGGSSIDKGYRVLPDSSGGYLLVGASQSYGAGGFDAWLTKIDSSGIPQWQKTYGAGLDDYAFDVIPGNRQ